MSLSWLEQIDATEIDTVADSADAYFPEIGVEWVEAEREHHDTDDDNAYSYDFVTCRKSDRAKTKDSKLL